MGLPRELGAGLLCGHVHGALVSAGFESPGVSAGFESRNDTPPALAEAGKDAADVPFSVLAAFPLLRRPEVGMP